MSQDNRETRNTTNPGQEGAADQPKQNNTIVFDWGDLNDEAADNGPNNELPDEDIDGGEEYGEDELGEEGEQEFEAPLGDQNIGGGCSIQLDFGLDDIFKQAMN